MDPIGNGREDIADDRREESDLPGIRVAGAMKRG